MTVPSFACRILVTALALPVLSGCATSGTYRAGSTGVHESSAAAAAPSTSASPASAPPSSVAPSGAPCDTASKWDCAQQARFAAASAYVARRPGKLAIVVRDRTTGAVWRAGPTGAATWTASTIKLAIAADLLERHRAGTITLDATDRTSLSAALVDSSNEATNALWARYDGANMLARFRDRYGMTGLSVVPGYDPYWRNLRCTADDLHALMSYVLDRLAADDRAYLVGKLRGVAGNQRWGVWAAGAGLRPGNKDGWAQKPDPEGTHWVTHTVGFAGPAERYVVAITYRLPPSGTLTAGVQAVSDLAATVFGGQVPAKVSTP